MRELTKFQEFSAALLGADEKLTHVRILRESPRDATKPGAMAFEARVQNWIKAQERVNGKAGLAVILFCPEGKPASRSNTGITGDMQMVIRVVENKSINEHPEHGTCIAAEDMLLEVMLLLQNWNPQRGRPVQVTDFYKADLEEPELWGWECVVTWVQAYRARPKCATPSVVVIDGVVTLSTTTVEAGLFYTLDGTLPTPATGVEYESPITDINPTALLVMAWKPGFLPSDCASESNL